jgi:DNA-binding MarR family transcriptional regulator
MLRLPPDRLAVGQLLVRLLQRFRREVLAVAAENGVTDLRDAHLHIFGNVGVDGVRLTTLAGRAQLSLAACAELVDDLQRKGYLERRRDPSDGRAKLILPTVRGREVLALAGKRVAEIETAWGDHVGSEAFDSAMRVLDRLVTALDEERGGRDS